MNCQTCNHPMNLVYGQSHHHCPNCNTFEFADEIDQGLVSIQPQGKLTDFQCPKCIEPLEVGLVHGNMQICFCNTCRGFVTPTQSLGEMIEDFRRGYDGPDDRPVPIDPHELDEIDNCPACLERMDSHPYYGPGNVVIDTCNDCQLAWLDYGELAKIIRAPGLRPKRAYS